MQSNPEISEVIVSRQALARKIRPYCLLPIIPTFLIFFGLDFFTAKFASINRPDALWFVTPNIFVPHPAGIFLGNFFCFFGPVYLFFRMSPRHARKIDPRVDLFIFGIAWSLVTAFELLAEIVALVRHYPADQNAILYESGMGFLAQLIVFLPTFLVLIAYRWAISYLSPKWGRIPDKWKNWIRIEITE